MYSPHCRIWSQLNTAVGQLSLIQPYELTVHLDLFQVVAEPPEPRPYMQNGF